MLLEFLSFPDGVKVFFHAPGEDEFNIGLRFVIDQKVQFAAIKPCLGKFVLHCNAIDRKTAASERIASIRLLSKSKQHL